MEQDCRYVRDHDRQSGPEGRFESNAWPTDHARNNAGALWWKSRRHPSNRLVIQSIQ